MNGTRWPAPAKLASVPQGIHAACERTTGVRCTFNTRLESCKRNIEGEIDNLAKFIMQGNHSLKLVELLAEDESDLSPLKKKTEKASEGVEIRSRNQF